MRRAAGGREGDDDRRRTRRRTEGTCGRRELPPPPARKSSRFWLVSSPHHRSQPRCSPSRPSPARPGEGRLAGWLAGCADGAKRAQGGSAPTAALGTHGFDYSRGQGQLFWLPCRRSRAWAPYMSSRFFFADQYVETGAPYTVVRRAHRIAG
jgi:hypothetical protein